MHTEPHRYVRIYSETKQAYRGKARERPFFAEAVVHHRIAIERAGEYHQKQRSHIFHIAHVRTSDAKT